MKWSKVVVEPCRVNVGGNTGTICAPDSNGGNGDGGNPPTPPTDDRCSDPLFRKANPGLCKDYPVLLIKPSVLTVCRLQGQKLKAFLYANKTEVEITEGLRWTSSNQSIATIGINSGKVTGVAEGIATVGVSWQNLTAHTQVTVLPGDGCCDDVKVGMVLVVDNSRSMGMAFNAVHATKLSFAKTLAYQWFNEVNTTKDVAALMTFNEAASQLSGFTNNTTALKTLATGITSTDKSTNIGDALHDAIELLDSDSSLTRKVVVLFTDGNNREGDEPIPIADAFEERGGIINVIALRAFSDGYDLLANIATGGFFLSAHSDSYRDIPDQMSGLKGYYCGGNCVPAGDIDINRAQLNYTAFANWNVTKNVVDLIGGTPPYDLFDLLPGHGLYVDLVGSPLGVDGRGKIETKTLFTFHAGVTYRLAFKLAGNQRWEVKNSQHYKVRAAIEGGDAGTVLSQVITIDDIAQPFTEYYFDFQGPGTGRITFEQTEIAGPPDYGLLLDDITLIRDPLGSTPTIVFEETFDDENTVHIAPQCGADDDGGYGYACDGYGCLTDPIGVQTEDPLPQPDLIEGEPIQSLGGFGGGGGSVEGFDPAGLFPTHTSVQQQDQLILAQAKAYIDEQLADVAKIYRGEFTDPNLHVIAEAPAIYYSTVDLSAWLKVNEGLNDIGWLIAQTGTISSPTDLLDTNGQPLYDTDGQPMKEAG